MSNYQVINSAYPGPKPVKAWINGVDLADNAKQQLVNLAFMPFVHKWVAAMPDAHFGMGATIGSVIATKGAIIPAAVGVDLGCGMIAARTGYMASDLPDNLGGLREEIEQTIPVGGPGVKGSWLEDGMNRPPIVDSVWADLVDGLSTIIEHTPQIRTGLAVDQLGTLGTGNHFIEVCLDTEQRVWVMLHSGSRGVGNRIASYFIEQAKKDMQRWFINLPDQDLAYIPQGSEHFTNYIKAISWAQDYAAKSREIMLKLTLDELDHHLGLPEGHARYVTPPQIVANCHHNYVAWEHHYGENVMVTRKGAVKAGLGDMGIIPGSMGTKSYIVRGKGNPESFNSCSHGAGRVMSRSEARRTISLERHVQSTSGVECRKDQGVLDESPDAYKDIDKVMEAQSDLVEIVHTLKQVMCVKG